MPNTTTSPCVQFDELFLHPLLDEPTTAVTAADRARQHSMLERARDLCSSCPMLAKCRFDAVARFDVAGFVGGTTVTERAQMRRLLKHKVAPEDFDSIVGVFTPNRQVDHDEVLRLRHANPHETLEQIAERLSCSLSTVKRHLRKARLEGGPTTLKQAQPTVEAVNYAAAVVSSGRRTTTRAA